MLLSMEGALHVSIDCNDAPWTGHLELQIGVMRDHIEAGKSGLSEQCMIAATEGAMLKIKSSLRELPGEPKTTSSMIEPVQRASLLGITPLKVVLVGLILDGSMPILWTVSL